MDKPTFELDVIRPWLATAEYVGSRVTCNPPPMDTDLDILVFLDTAFNPDINKLFADVHVALLNNGYEVGGSLPADIQIHVNSTEGFMSYTKDEINLIITADLKFYERFLLASKLCTRFNLLDKPDRIRLFQAVLYQLDIDNEPVTT